MSVASITVVGRLGRDPEVKVTQAGKQLVTASVAVSAGKDKPSTWFNIVAFENMGKWLVGSQKGDMIFVQGDLEFKTYEKKDGTVGYEHSVFARTIRAMSKREPSPEFSGSQDGGQQSFQSSNDMPDFDVPFHHEPRRVNEACLNERAFRTI